jgi:uncharacterized protein (DUF1810 family)
MQRKTNSDHAQMLKQLTITSLRQGASGNASAPNAANYDESKAVLFPDLPKLLVLKNGKKVSHWMWFIFPQISGLGKSGTAKKYEIANIEEAEYYLMDELLSKRLLELTRILAYEVEGKTTEEIFGFPDYLKFQSSMTLFYSVVISNRQLESDIHYKCFEDAIRKYFDGKTDNFTLEILKRITIL